LAPPRRTWFNPAVPILLGRKRLNVNSLEWAAEILMSEDWPSHGPMCERVTPNEVRQAFEDAAREARVLIE
jgi:hypothetical protein